MVNPKVKAAYEYNHSGNVYYRAYDLSGYENDVKYFVRKLEIYRTDTNALIRSQILDAGSYSIGNFIQTGHYPNDPYINNLGIKAVLIIDDVIVAEDEIEFVSSPVLLTDITIPSVIKRTAGSDHYFSIKDNIIYPFYQELDIDDYERFAYALRRNTADAQLNKLEYIMELDSETIEVEFPYFNELVLVAFLVFFDKTTHQAFSVSNAAFVNPNTEINQYFSPGGTFNGDAENNPLGDEDAPLDLSKLEGIEVPVLDLSGEFSISKLVKKFELYAQKLKLLKHNPNQLKERAFFNLDFEEIQQAIKDGCKFPLMVFQTPEVGKDGNPDGVYEGWEGSFIILDKINTTKADCISKCKIISDKVFRKMLADAPDFFDGSLVQTNEGLVGPTTDKLYGWIVTFGFTEAFDAEVNPQDWEGVI